MAKRNIVVAIGMVVLLSGIVVMAYSSQRGSKAEARKEGTIETGVKPSKTEVHITTVFENDRVTVTRYVIGPYAKVPMHDVPNLVAVWLSDAHLKLTFPDGTSKEESFKAGDATWMSAHRHAGENLSDGRLEFISVALRDKPMGAR